MARITNRAGFVGSVEDALVGADVFLGVSSGLIAEDAIATMAANSIIFALADPRPEVAPDVAHRHASVYATGRSDYPNQINNVLAFPGIFAGAFDCGACTITEGMKLAAATALGDVVADFLEPDRIVPTPFDARVVPAVAAAVAEQARREGVRAGAETGRGGDGSVRSRRIRRRRVGVARPATGQARARRRPSGSPPPPTAG